MPSTTVYKGRDSLAEPQVVDTIYGIKGEALIPFRKAKFSQKEEVLTKEILNPLPLNTRIENWQTIFLLGTVLLLGLSKLFSKNYHHHLRALISYNVSQEIAREEQALFNRSNILLIAIQLITFSLLVYQFKGEMLEENTKGFDIFLIIAASMSIVYLVKYTFSKLLFFIFNHPDFSSTYIFNVLLYNNFLGVLLIPILCVNYFTTIPFYTLLFYVVFPLALLVFLFRLVRLFVIGRTLSLLYVYIILYICSLEILPLVILHRIFIH